jgi:Zn-dependent protease with chaperone function
MAHNAKFYDGNNAKAHKVTITLSTSYIIIEARDRSFQYRWPYHDIRIISEPRVANPGRITVSTSPDARLLIENPKIWNNLSKKVKKLKAERRPFFSSPLKNAVLGCSFLIFLIIVVISTSSALTDKSVAILPESLFKAVGKKALLSMANGPLCISEEGQSALNKLAETLQSSHSSKKEIRIIVLKDKNTVNAFAFPGNYIMLTSGLLEYIETQEELSGIMAHELSHAYLLHPRKNLIRSAGSFILVQLAFDGAQIAEIADFFASLTYSRQDETEADTLALKLLAQSSINPHGLKLFFSRSLDEQDTDQLPFQTDFFSTHPGTNKRAAMIEKALLNEENRDYKKPLSSQQWNALQKICESTLPLTEQDL